MDYIGEKNNMIIHHRGIYPDRFDAPFGIGTLVWAKDCHHHCPDCFHQDRFDLPIIEEESSSIIDRVLEGSYTNGIVLGGFEWMEQYDEMINLIEEARGANLEVILFTHYTAEEISEYYSELLNYKGVYVKCGEYDKKCLSATYTSYGVPLASTNQAIYKIGVDI